jgi:DNA-binding IclR family transcriptional regulator
VAQQGLGSPQEFGPNAPASLEAVLQAVKATRERGFSVTEETYTAGLNAMAAPVQLAGQPPMGIISIAGPTVRFTLERMLALGPDLLALTAQLAAASGASPFFSKPALRPAHAASGLKPIYAA